MRKLVFSKQRSKWKIPYTRIIPLRLTLTKKKSMSLNKKSYFFRKKTYVWTKSSVILPVHVGHRFTILNGKTFYLLNVIKEMIGHKFGEFVFTTKMGSIIHNSIKNKKRK